jgi:quercetin dioxygenase-like cupin family protein
MRKQIVILMAVVSALVAAPAVEKLRNAQVVVRELTLKPGERVSVENRPSVTVYFGEGSVEFRPAAGAGVRAKVKEGETVFRPAEAGEIRNAGPGDLKFVRTEFLTGGAGEAWGAAGLAPQYKVLIENSYARVYEIRIPAGAREQQHTHHARVVVCLSGADLRHGLPDGREETATLKTGEVAWRAAATHTGHNVGTTDLWTIAIEPK